MGESGPLVDFAAVTNVVEIQASLAHIELVKHSVIPDAQLAFCASGEAFVRILGEPHSHFIDLALDVLADGQRQSVEGARKGMRPDLEGGCHGLFGLAGGVFSSGNLTP